MEKVEVALFGIPKTLHYAVEDDVRVGELVSVDIKGRVVRGVVVSKLGKAGNDVKRILLREGLYVDEARVEVARWISRYYVCNLWEALRMFFPSGALSGETRLVKLNRRKLKLHYEELSEKERALVDMLKHRKHYVSLKNFNYSQRKLLEELSKKGIVRIKEYIRPIRFSSFKQDYPILSFENIPDTSFGKLLSEIVKHRRILLYGDVHRYKLGLYLKLAQNFIQKGSILIITPDVLLATEIGTFLNERLGNVAVYHGSLTETQKASLWIQAHEGKISLVVGTRSALFLPMKDLKLVILDEENDPLHKQNERRPFYHARDVALYMSEVIGFNVILTSQIPSVESFYNALRGKLKPYSLGKPKGSKVYLVDMRKEAFIISRKANEVILNTLRKGGKVALFINRRGYSKILMCRNCGYVYGCPNCSVSLFFHKDENVLTCHICGYTVDAPKTCIRCSSDRLIALGSGTQRIQEILRKAYPDFEVVRMDGDVLRRRKLFLKAIQRIYSGKPCMIVGTNVLSRSLNLSTVESSVVLLADMGMNAPDFRARERLMQFIVDVRSRMKDGSMLLVQTFNPESEFMKLLGKPLDTFYESELRYRRKYMYPPFVRIAIVEVSYARRERAIERITRIRQELEEYEQAFLNILGPTPAPVEKQRGLYVWRILLKYRDYRKVSEILSRYISDEHVRVIVDPV